MDDITNLLHSETPEEWTALLQELESNGGAEEEEPNTPLRYSYRNQARNWGSKVTSMRKHAPGIWWFTCSSEDSGGHNGYLVCDKDAPISKMPEHDIYRVRQLRSGEWLYTFDDDMDMYLLEWFMPNLAARIYKQGREKGGWTKEFYENFPTLKDYQEFLDGVAKVYYTDIYEAVNKLAKKTAVKRTPAKAA